MLFLTDTEAAPGPNAVSVNSSPGEKVPSSGNRETSVMQLGVKSASSAGPCTMPGTVKGPVAHALLMLVSMFFIYFSSMVDQNISEKKINITVQADQNYNLRTKLISGNSFQRANRLLNK